jgi:hypothetical protein
MNIPTTVSIDMFSGLKFESLTSLNLNLINGNINQAVPGGWKFVAKNQFLTIFLKEVKIFLFRNIQYPILMVK